MSINGYLTNDGRIARIDVPSRHDRPALRVQPAEGIDLWIEAQDLSSVVGIGIDVRRANPAAIARLVGVAHKRLATPGSIQIDPLLDRDLNVAMGRLALAAAFEHPRFLCGASAGLWRAEQLALLHHLEERGVPQDQWLGPMANSVVASLIRHVPPIRSSTDPGRHLVDGALAYLDDRVVGYEQLAQLVELNGAQRQAGIWLDLRAAGRWIRRLGPSPDAARSMVFDGLLGIPEESLTWRSASARSAGALQTTERRWDVVWPLTDALDYRVRPTSITTSTVEEWILEVGVSLTDAAVVSQPVCSRVVSAEGAVISVGALFRSDAGLEGTLHLARPLGHGDRVELETEPYAPVFSEDEYERHVALERTLTGHRDATLGRQTAETQRERQPDPSTLSPFAADHLTGPNSHHPSSE